MNDVNKINDIKSKIESLFSYFSRVFSEIDAKINLKSNKIYNTADKNKEEIEQMLNGSKIDLIFESIKDSLNQRRHLLLEKLKLKMAQDVNEVNEKTIQYKKLQTKSNY